MLIICTNDVEELLLCLLINCVSSYVKYFLDILLIFNCIVYLISDVLDFLICSAYKCFLGYMCYKQSLPLCALPFHILMITFKFKFKFLQTIKKRNHSNKFKLKMVYYKVLRTLKNQHCSGSNSIAITTNTQLWCHQTLDMRISAIAVPDKAHTPGLQETNLPVKPLLNAVSSQISLEFRSRVRRVAAREPGKCSFLALQPFQSRQFC